MSLETYYASDAPLETLTTDYVNWVLELDYDFRMEQRMAHADHMAECLAEWNDVFHPYDIENVEVPF